MRLANAFSTFAFLLTVAAAPRYPRAGVNTARSDNLAARDGADGLTLAEIDALTPPFGHDAGINPTGTGNCDGAVDGPNGLPIEVPCSCPPPRDQFIQVLAENIAAGDVVNNPSVPITFPTDNSTASILARFSAASSTLQNLNGIGVGCPVDSTTWVAQADAIENENGGAPPSTVTPTTPVTSPTSAAPTSAAPTSDAPPSTTSAITGADGLTLAQIDALTPPFGHAAGINPTGTGNCDGAVDDATGAPVEVPCFCPPPRDQFIEALAANMAAGHVVDNPSVPIQFPTDNSTNSILTRFSAASATLQNFNGQGVGCPIQSTTWAAQADAVRNGD